MATTKAPSHSAAAENTPEIPERTDTDAEMVDTAPQWMVENDTWHYIHTEIQEDAAAAVQAAHEVLLPPTTACHAPDPDQQQSMSDLNKTIASMQVTFDALTELPCLRRQRPSPLAPPRSRCRWPWQGILRHRLTLKPWSRPRRLASALDLPPLPGFSRATASTSPSATPMVTTTKTPEGYRIDALPESFPRLSSMGATLALTVPELCQLFAKFLDTPLTGPGVERIIQVYLPTR